MAKYIGATDAARLVPCAKATIYNAIARKRLRWYKVADTGEKMLLTAEVRAFRPDPRGWPLGKKRKAACNK